MRKDGQLVVLELTQPQNFPVKQIYQFHTRYILPNIGKLFSKDQNAYSYLPESIRIFPEGERFLHLLEQQSFKSTKWVPLTFGVCSIYMGDK